MIVVPKPLVSHWREQISWHVARGALPGEVLVDPLGDFGDTGPDGATAPLRRVGSLRDHYSASKLASASIVLTCCERLTHEQRLTASGGGESVLAELKWVRLMCDEGHHLGGGAVTNAKRLLERVVAERR